MHRVLIVSMLAALAACSQPAGPAVKVSDSWARATAEGQVAAVYATIRNEGGEGDRLMAASTDSASTAMIHEGGMEGGIARMRMAHSLDIPAGAEVKLAPGGNHIMLEGLKTPLAAGDRFQMALRFEQAGAILVPVSVVAPGSR